MTSRFQQHNHARALRAIAVSRTCAEQDEMAFRLFGSPGEADAFAEAVAELTVSADLLRKLESGDLVAVEPRRAQGVDKGDTEAEAQLGGQDED